MISSSDSGISYVETSSLDGEKNLKPKISISETQLNYNETKALPDFNDVKAEINCDPPNPNINKFAGTLSYQGKGIKFDTKMNHKNLLLRGCKVKNTDWVIGLAIYTGLNTKLMQNGSSAVSKTSTI